jgi:very-short-patch-repair endonuclease
VIHGLPVVPPEVAWLQLATQLSLDELIVAGDVLVRRRSPLSSLERMETALHAARGARGVHAAAAALREIRPGTDSPPESTMRLILVRAGLPEPLVRYQVNDDGYFVGTPDLAYPSHKVALEYQGDGHREWEVFEDDIVRLDLFHAAGWKVLQVTKRQLRDPVRLANRVRGALASCG